MKKLFRITLWLAVVGGSAVLFLLHGLPLFLSLPEELSARNEASTVVTDRNGVPLRRFLVNGEEVVSAYATLEDIPPQFVDATVAAEDKRFWQHHGIDYAALVRAALDGLEQGYQVSGASTISQQLIKITDVPRPRTLRTKALEILLARKLEKRHDKKWIFENYINRIPYGNLRTGCRAAAEGYFGKPLQDLTVAECAFLAALPNKPTRFNPYKNFEGARHRQLWILDRMQEDGYITEAQCERAKAEPIVLVRQGSAFRAPHAVDLLVARHRDQLRPGQVRSTIDLDLQTFAEAALDEHLHFIAMQRQTSPSLHAAVVVIENRTGHVLVLTGSRDYHDGHAGQVNGAWMPRSPGSALKPFTYLLALQQGFPATTMLADVPSEFGTSSGVYRPVNYDRTFTGPVSFREALGNSLNIPAVKLMQRLGGPDVLKRGLGEAGITTLTKPAAHYGLGLTIGSGEVRLLELTNAYACLARLGRWKPYRLLWDDSVPEGKAVFDRDACYLIADMLSDNRARARSFGWNSALCFRDLQVAAKTGTSSDYRDAWTLGFTPAYTVGVWVGNFDNTPLDHFSGAAGAGPIFHAMMERLHRDEPSHWYGMPEGVTAVRVDSRTGFTVSGGVSPALVEEALVAKVALPLSAAPAHYDAAGRVRLDREYASWYAAAPRSVQDRFVLRQEVSPRELRIRFPVDGMVIYLDPDLANGGRELRLAADGEAVQWSSPTLAIDREAEVANLVAGDHEITAEDPRNGARKTVRITVEDA